MIKELLKQIEKGSHEEAEIALKEIYINYGNRIINLANKILNDRFYSEEVLNDVLLKIWNNSKLLSHLSNPLGYITTMTYNRAIDIKRRQKELLKEDVNLILDKKSYDQFIPSDNVTKLDIVLQSLSKLERTILILKDAYNYSFYTISKLCNLSYKQTRTRYLKAFEICKKNLQEWENNN